MNQQRVISRNQNRRMMTALMLMGCALAASSPVLGDEPSGGSGHEPRPDRTVNCLKDPQTYTSINAAIAASNNGDTILVCPGIYRESVVINRENLKLISEVEGAAKIYPPILGPRQAGILIVSNGATIDGFAIAGFGEGIFVSEVSFERIRDNTIFDNGTGISLRNSFANRIERNLVTDNTASGILDFITGVQTRNGTVYERNTIQYNGEHGIFINAFAPISTTGGEGEYRALITKNRLNNNTRNGAHLNFSSAVKVLYNELSYNGEDGIQLIESDFNLIKKNKAFVNGRDIDLCGPADNCAGIRLNSSSDHNWVIENVAFGNLAWDAQDNTSGDQTAGTANLWKDNRCRKDTPDGLCED